MIIKPKPLNKGDKVAIVAPSSPTLIEFVNIAEKAVKSIGLNPVMYPSCYAKHGHFAGNDILRAKDINDAFSNENIKGVICLKGGYGTPRILNLIDYENIKRNPKIFLGFSDITGLHIAINNCCRMVTYHGPMASYGWVHIDPYTKYYLNKCLFSEAPLGIIKNPDGEKLNTLVEGDTSGEIIGGNLSLLVSNLDSPYEINTKGKILFIEDVGEKNYKIDRMLTSLALAGKFNDCNGVILGTWSGCTPDARNGISDLDLLTIFKEIISPYNKPTIMNFRAGHNYPQPTFPLGTLVKLNAAEKEIHFLESGNE